MELAQTSPVVPVSSCCSAFTESFPDGTGEDWRAHGRLELEGTLRSVGAVFTMTAGSCSSWWPAGSTAGSPLASTCTSSFELTEFGRQLAAKLVDKACERRVWFNSPANTGIPITPYSRVYGVHPRFFHVGQGATMQLTPVGFMMHTAGWTRALGGGSRMRSVPPRRSATSTVEEADMNASAISASSSTSRVAVAAATPLPPDVSTDALLQNPMDALEVFLDMSGWRAAFHDRANVLKSNSEAARSLGEDVKTLRETIAARKQQLADTGDVGITLTPAELAAANEVEELRAQFQAKTWELWRVKGEVDTAQLQLEEDTVQMQKDFSSWLSSIRKTRRASKR